MQHTRRGAGRASLMLGLLLVVLTPLAVASATPAQAASYRYWSYWQGTSASTWTYSSQGAGTFRPKDGSVQGWRFAVSQGANSSSTPPRVQPTFSSLCQGVAATDGTRRVGLVIDYGTSSDSPNGESPRAIGRYCVRVADGSTGLAVVTAVTSIRTRDGLVCGISGYPKSECATVVRSEPTSAPAASKGGSTTSGSSSGGSTTSSSSKGASAAGGSSPRTAATSDAATAPTDRNASPEPSAPTDPSSTDESPGSATSQAPSPDATVIDAANSSGSTGSAWPTLIALAVAVAVAAAALVTRRRRR